MADRTVLDEAAEALRPHADKCAADDWRCCAAVALRVAADRLRAERDRVHPPIHPPNEYLDGLRAGYGNAANTLTEGTDHAE